MNDIIISLGIQQNGERSLFDYEEENLNALKHAYNIKEQLSVTLKANSFDFENDTLNNIFVFAINDLKDKDSYAYSLFKYDSGQNIVDSDTWAAYVLSILDSIANYYWMTSRPLDWTVMAAIKKDWYFKFYIPNEVLSKCFGEESTLLTNIPHSGFLLCEINPKYLIKYVLPGFYSYISFKRSYPFEKSLGDFSKYRISID